MAELVDFVVDNDDLDIDNVANAAALLLLPHYSEHEENCSSLI